MNYQRIKMLQKAYGVTELQDMINSGQAWLMEGSIGRKAMVCLEAGVCMLPLEAKRDYYGSTIPARTQLKQSTKGGFQNCVEFWQRVWDGDFETIEALEEMFGVETEDEVA